MTKARRTVAAMGLFAAACAILQASDAAAATQLIYRVAGVRDDSNVANTGIATSFLCTNIGVAPATIRIIVHNKLGTPVGDLTFVVNAGDTHTASTHNTASLFDDHVLSAGSSISQGFAQIRASSRRVICSAITIDASAAAPAGVSLHMVRYAPIPKTLE